MSTLHAPTALGAEADAPAGFLARVFSPHGELFGALIAGGLLLVGWVLGRIDSTAVAGHAMVWASLGVGMIFGGKAALEALRERKVDIDVLMVVGAGLAASVGAAAEGALLLFLFTLSGALEDLAMRRTTRAVEALHKLMPTKALRLRAGTSNDWEETAPEALAKDDRIRILPGELVPTDAKLVLGSSSINQASITGESMPRDVRVGDDLFAGTVNVGNPIEAVVTKPAAQSSLQKILNLVMEAQQQREPVQRLIDKVSQPYALSVFGVSGAVMLIWHYMLGVPWVSGTSGGTGGAIYTAITLLIVASPCALIISTPTATLAAISRAARGGVLFKGGQAIERLSRLRAIAFDKTGTLTIGRPRVMQIHAVGWSDERRLLSVAAALELQSTHPIATAIVELAKSRGVEPAAAEQVGNTTGRGVEGMVDGKIARLGSSGFTDELVPACLKARVHEVLDQVRHRGNIGVVCVHDGQAGVFILSDAVRPGAECLVERLHAMGVRPVMMLTGDNLVTAERVASSLGIDEVHAQLLPPDKVAHVERVKRDLKGRGGVGVIGDGVNDAPALAAADVSIAVGSIGSDAALESADIVLLSDDLSAVPWAAGLARRARRTIAINLSFSIGAIVVMFVGVLLGHWLGYTTPLWMGVLGHEGGTLLVVAHSLLLLAYPAVQLCSCDRSGHQHASLHTQLTVSAAGEPVEAKVEAGSAA